MSSATRHPSGVEDTERVESSVSQILKLILSLSPAKVRASQSLAGLTAVRDALDKLILETSNSEPDSTERTDATRRPSYTAKQSPIEEPELQSEMFHSGNAYWRTKRKTQEQRDEKKARLAKREELIRQLRSRVSESLKSDNLETSIQEDRASHQFTSGEQDKYSTRLQRASFWPTGSVEWARQLLGVELGMTEAEKRLRYIEMVKLCHPDHNNHVPADAIQMVNEAWELLR